MSRVRDGNAQSRGANRLATWLTERSGERANREGGQAVADGIINAIVGGSFFGVV